MSQPVRAERVVEKSPRLLIIGNFLSGAKASRGVCEDLALRLQAAGWTVRTTSRERGRVRRLWSMLTSVWRWRREYAVSQVDLYSGLAFTWGAAVIGLLRALRKPFVVTLHGGRLPEYSRRRPRLVRAALHSARAVTAPSEYLRREMRPYCDSIILLPNPLEIAAYPFALRDHPRPRLVWLRAFHEIYNPSLAVETLALVLAEYPEATLTMIGPDRGDGSLERVRDTVATRSLSARVRIIEGITKSRVGAALAEADLFLNTTNVDNAPVSLIEAMACGLCVISTNVGGVPDLICDGVNGLLVPPSDATAMAAAVCRILRNGDLAARLSSNGRRHAQACDWSVVLPKWEELLKEAASSGEALGRPRGR